MNRDQRSSLRPLLAGLALASAALLAAAVGGCSRETSSPRPNLAAQTPRRSSAECSGCHAQIAAAWAASDHAAAHRLVDGKADADAFATPQTFALHGVDYRTEWQAGKPHFTETRSGAAPENFHADFVLGRAPLRQYVVPVERGRYQLTEIAFDPARKDWFNVFGDERRQPGEWGHWRGRGMMWNAMCAHCHLTEFRKNYDPATDTFSSTWREHGIGCFQCHGDLPANHGQPDYQRGPASDRKQAQETCAPCHARGELLTGAVQPNVAFNDHHRLTLPTDAAVFYPDGQMRDEVFNYTSFLTSRMGGKAGVTCLDCHDPHSGKTKLPVANNAICMQCHAAPGPLQAPVINPTAHSHHAEGSTGNQCVSCHMPTTTYMQRDPRHDHGFIKPDPLLTRELGIPNACNRCHTDKSVDWAIESSERWYGSKLASRQRERARVVAAAQANATDAANRLLAMIASEDVPAWKATFLTLARPFAATEPRLLAAARAATQDTDPLVRSTAVQVLGADPNARGAIEPLLRDPVRLVRLDAAWLLTEQLADGSPERRELDTYLAISADQPGGRIRIAQDLFNRGRIDAAEAQARVASGWDTNSPDVHETVGLILNAAGKPAEAAASLWRAARLRPSDAGLAFNAALAFAGAAKLADAEVALREAIKRSPRHDRAWYNLGLLLAQTNRQAESLRALAEAEAIAPHSADYPYARATLLWQRGDRAGAKAAAEKALRIDPNHAGAAQLLRQR